jgi:uridylate kinase
LNAELVRGVLGWKGVFHDPNRAASEFPKVVCGGWKPGRTTDYVSAFLASLVGANVVNITNVEHVYDKDPNKHKDAKPIEKLGWKEMIDICGTEHRPGINAPFAPVACKFAMEKGLKVIVVGKDLENLRSLLEGKGFVGTTVE